MVEELSEINDYLPIAFNNSSDEEYISFLWNSFESNYNNMNFQFAYVAYHMLLMSFLYFKIWQLKIIKNFDFTYVGFHLEEENALCGSSPFAFCKINERSILKYFRLINCENSKIIEYKKLIDLRNDLVHSNGNIYFKDETSFLKKITDALKCISEIENKSQEVVLDQFEQFLLKSCDDYELDSVESVDFMCISFIQSNYISNKDIEFCINYDINKLSERNNFEDIIKLYNYFNKKYRINEDL